MLPLLVTLPLATPLALRPLGTLRPIEDILTLLTRASFSGSDALHIYGALFGFLHGHVLIVRIAMPCVISPASPASRGMQLRGLAATRRLRVR